MSTIPPDELMALTLWGTALDDDETGRRAASAGANLRDVVNAIGVALESASTGEAAVLRHRLGYLALASGEARGKAHEAFTLMRAGALEAGDERHEAMAECGLAAVFDFVGERHEALLHARAARRLAEKVGDRRTLAIALNEEAQHHKENGENERAFGLFERIAAVGRELGDRELVMAGHIGMGRTTPMQRAGVGIGHYEQAIELARTAGDDAALALCLCNMSDWKIYGGQYEEAIALREQSLELARLLGLRPLIGRCIIGIAKARTLLGDLDEARALLDRGFPLVVSTADLEGDLHSELNLAYLFVRGGDVPRAVGLYRQVLERSLAAPDHACAVFAQRALELLADAAVPPPGILPDEPVSTSGDADPATTERADVGAGTAFTYPTGDMKWLPLR